MTNTILNWIKKHKHDYKLRIYNITNKERWTCLGELMDWRKSHAYWDNTANKEFLEHFMGGSEILHYKNMTPTLREGIVIRIENCTDYCEYRKFVFDYVDK